MISIAFSPVRTQTKRRRKLRKFIKTHFVIFSASLTLLLLPFLHSIVFICKIVSFNINGADSSTQKWNPLLFSRFLFNFNFNFFVLPENVSVLNPKQYQLLFRRTLSFTSSYRAERDIQRHFHSEPKVFSCLLRLDFTFSNCFWESSSSAFGTESQELSFSLKPCVTTELSSVSAYGTCGLRHVLFQHFFNFLPTDFFCCLGKLPAAAIRSEWTTKLSKKQRQHVPEKNSVLLLRWKVFAEKKPK